MRALIYGITLQWKLDLRNKGILLTYYIVPLVFFAFMSGIFTATDPNAYQTLIPSMTVFGVTMGAILGSPSPLIDLFGSEMKKAYLVGHIPLWTAVLNNFISAFIHLFAMSLIIFCIAPIAFDASVPSHLVVYFIALTLFIITCLAIATLLGLYIKSASKLTMIGQFIFLPSVMLSGIMFPVSMLPDWLANIGKILPATWGYQSMCTNTLTYSLVWPLLAALLLCTFLSVWKLKKLKVD